MQKENLPKIASIAFGVLVLSFLIGFYAFAQWGEPTAEPPGDNVEIPLNVGPEAQTKAGQLGIGAYDDTYGLTVEVSGKKGIKVTGEAWFQGNVTSTNDICLSSGQCLSTAGGAPTNASYVVLGLVDELTAEKVLIGGAGLSRSVVGDDVILDIGAGTGILVATDTISVNTTWLETNWSDTRYIQNVIANKGLQRDGSNNFGIMNCSTDQIMKYNASAQWGCAEDLSGAGVADSFVKIADAGGTTQFSASGVDTLRFEGSGATTVNFVQATKKVTFTSTDDYNPDNQPTAAVRGEPTRAEIESWGDLYDTDTWITTQTCSAGQYLSSVGKTSRTCSTPSGGVGDITGVYSGEGTKGGAASDDVWIEFDCSEVVGTGLACSGEDVYIQTTYQGADARCGVSNYLRGDGVCRSPAGIVSDGGGLSASNDYGRWNISSTLYEGTTALSNKYLQSESDTLSTVTSRGQSTAYWLYSPKFVDYNNSSYYADPNSVSYFFGINLGGVTEYSWPSDGGLDCQTYVSGTKSCDGGSACSQYSVYCSSYGRYLTGGGCWSADAGAYIFSSRPDGQRWACGLQNVGVFGRNMRTYVVCCR